jgi:hypothetical protein
MGSPALNVGAYVAVCVGLSAIPAVAMAAWRRRVRLMARLRRLFGRPERAPEPLPAGPSLEQIAHDLHRIAAYAGSMPAKTTWVRHRGAELAYDDVLIAACRALDVRHELREVPSGWEHDVERLRVEACLECAGLRVRRNAAR